MLLLLFACADKGEDTATTPVASGPLGDGDPLNPFPSTALVADGLVAIPEGLLPAMETPFPVDIVNGREGFSVVQPSIVNLGVPIDPASLSAQEGLGVGGSIRMVDLNNDAEIPCFAELDAWPEAIPGVDQALIVRPVVAMTPGHSVAVVITSGVVSSDGTALPLPAWKAARENDSHLDALYTHLGTLGYEDIVLAWDFPVGDGTGDLTSILSTLTTPSGYTIERVTDADEEPGILPEGIWRRIEGSFTADNWLVDDLQFERSPDPVAQGSGEVPLFVYVPDSLRGAPAGSVPVILFGHGILSNPGDYFDEDGDPNGSIDLANRLGAIVVATTWRGLTTEDLLDTVNAASDFGKFPQLTDRLTQAVVNNEALLKLLREGTLLDDPALEGLADRERYWYYGISLGAIEGSVVMANQEDVTLAALHVGGSAWSTMLERSSDWPTFEALIVSDFSSPLDRQRLYSASQLLWDPVDPASYVDALATKGFLYQEAIGDNQVPNITSELLMRSLGVPLGTPEVRVPYGMETVALPTSAPVFVQFDPEKGDPAGVNRPASDTQAHNLPRGWEGQKEQVKGYFESGGTVEHFCGDGPCSASSPGE